jgi:uncharacterized membrane protein YdcZ (DUF606 family)
MSYFPHHPGFYSALMLLAGIGIPIMAALNAGLGSRLANPAYSAVILFSVGLLASTGYLLIVQGIPTSLPPAGIPVHFYLGGLFVLFYVLSITWVAPRFGRYRPFRFDGGQSSPIHWAAIYRTGANGLRRISSGS